MISILICAAAVVPQQADTLVKEAPTVISLEDAIKITLSENVSVKIADKEIKRQEYAKKGTYSSLWPKIDATGNYTRTIAKQMMYMDGDGFDITKMVKPAIEAYVAPLYDIHGIPLPNSGSESSSSSSSDEGIPVGRWNAWSGGITASMPLVNAQLWRSLRISDQDVELTIEKARDSRLSAVNQVKKAFYACLLAKDAFKVYKMVYENAVENLEQTQRKYNSQRASELDLTRAKTNVANAIPNVYDSESAIVLAMWQLKAVMGVDLEMNIDIKENLDDYVIYLDKDLSEAEYLDLDNNSSIRQLAIQAEQLANMVKMRKYADIPTLSLAFAYNMTASTNDFNFSQYKWSPYSYAALSLNIPIFAGGKRRSDIKQAVIQAQELDLRKAETERQLRIAIRQYLKSMDTANKSYNAAQSALETAQKAYDIASKSYNIGRSTLTDLNAAQLALVQCNLNISQSIYAFMVAKSEIENVLGADFTK